MWQIENDLAVPLPSSGDHGRANRRHHLLGKTRSSYQAKFAAIVITRKIPIEYCSSVVAVMTPPLDAHVAGRDKKLKAFTSIAALSHQTVATIVADR
jgi:hypothetical protein